MAAGDPFQNRSEELFQKVVEQIALSMILGPGIVKRALGSVGADWKAATPKNYLDSLAALEKRLAAYMDPATARQRIAEVRKLLQGWK